VGFLLAPRTPVPVTETGDVKEMVSNIPEENLAIDY